MAHSVIVYFPQYQQKFAVICREEGKSDLKDACFRRWHHLKETSARKCAEDHLKEKHGGGKIWLAGFGPNGEWSEYEVTGCD